MWALWKTALFAVFQVPCGRVLCVHTDGSVHIVFVGAKIFKHVEPRSDSVAVRVVEKGGYQSSGPPRENRSWGILSGFFFALPPSDLQGHAHRSFRTAASACCSNTAG